MAKLFTTVFDMSLTATAVILVVLVLRVLLARAPKKYSYYLWAAAAFRLICPVSVSSVFSLFNLPVSRMQQETVITIPGETVIPAVPAVPGSGVSEAPQYTVNVTPPTVNAVNWDEVLSVVWIVGAVAVLLIACMQVFRLWSKTRFAVRLEGNVWQSDSIPGPFVLGLFRPKIFLPVWLKEGEQEHVLAHERYHIKRRDNWVKAVCQIILAIHWFNPFVWLMMWAVDRDMELSCDEGALKRLGEDKREGYSRTLLSLAVSRREVGPVLAFGAPAVKKRIVNVLRYHKAAKITVVLAVTVLLIAGLTCCTDAKTKPATSTEPYAQALYDARVEYVGDNSAVIGLIDQMLLENELEYDSVELHTDEEPYGLTLNLFLPEWWDYQLEDHFAVDDKAFSMSVLLLALIDNLDYCWQSYDLIEHGERVDYAQIFPKMSVAQAELFLGIDDLKSYGDSPEKISELLTLIGKIDVQTVKYALANAEEGLTASGVKHYQYEGDGTLTLSLYGDGTHTLRHEYEGGALTYAGSWMREDDLIALQFYGGPQYKMFFSTEDNVELYFQKQLSTMMTGLEIYEMLAQGACFRLVTQEEPVVEDNADPDFILYDMVDPQLDDVTIYAPQVALFENGESAIFHVENDAIGHYSEENGILTLTDEMNDRIYLFRRIDSNTIEFIADGSDEVIMAVENDYKSAPIVDGTRFTSNSGQSVTIQVGTAVVDRQVERYQLVVAETQSTGRFLPTLRLYSDGTYIFNHSTLSSQYHTGTWIQEDSILTLTEPNASFRFRRLDDYTLQFLEEGSYGYDQYPEFEITFGDGDQFRRSVDDSYDNWPDLVLVSHGGRYQIQGLDAQYIDVYPSQNGVAGDIYFVNPEFLGTYFEGKYIEGSASWKDESETSICVGFTQSAGESDGTLTGPSLNFELDLNTGELSHITFVTYEANGEEVTMTGYEMKEMGYMLASLLQMTEHTVTQ